MRIVVWNCKMALSRKRQHLYDLWPDVAIILECAKDSVDHCIEDGFSGRWFGDKPQKGLGVLVAKPWKITRIGKPRNKWVVPLCLRGDAVRYLLILTVIAGFAPQSTEKTYTQSSVTVHVQDKTAQRQTITLTEPAVVKIEDLLKQADFVAVVRILSGDTEQYSSAVYKAEVLESFKGAGVGTTVYFGPFITYGLGSKYLVFLRRSERGIEPKQQTSLSGLNYGPIAPFYLVMYDGESVLPIEYTCVFDGKVPNESCDYGIKLNTHQVVLPKNLKAFPRSSDDPSCNNSRWVRKAALISYLQKLSN